MEQRDKILEEYYAQMGIAKPVYDFCMKVEEELKDRFLSIDKTAECNQMKVLRAMQKNHLSEACFAPTTGYGYNDIGRETLEKIYADVFGTEDALVRPQITCGTHALALALMSQLRPGDELLSPVGKPYDTLEEVIGIRPSNGSLAEYGISYHQVDLLHFIKERKPDVLCMVDNCYGEFVEIEEPSQVGADLIVGSLIKNPGGGLAPIGGYLCGTKECIDRAAYRLTSPGLGKEVGATLGVTTSLTQGLFLAPTVVKGALKGAVFAANIYEKLGFKVIPDSKESRHDIIQEVEFHDPELMVAFCEGIQAAAPVDSFVRPEPWDMPGYDAQVIMAAGAFVSGSSIELSADGPMKEPYAVYFQGGLTWEHAKYGIMMSLQKIYETGKLKNILINDTES